MISNFKSIKPLVIGIGVAGRRHLEAQLNLGVKTGVYTTNPQTAKSLRENKNIIVFDNLEEGIDWSDLVHVCTPDDKHTSFVALAIKKGKSVLCEKSLATNLKDALYLQKLSHQNKAILVVGQNYRLTPTFLETRKRVLNGNLGRITKIETTYLHDRNDYKKRYKDTNFLYIGGSHAVDLACWVIDEQVKDIGVVSASKLSYQIAIKFSSGVSGSINLDASLIRPMSGTDLIVEGEKGKLISHNKIDKLLFYKTGNRKAKSSYFPNTSTFTIALEVNIIDEYLLGRRNSYWPLPNLDETINTIKILDSVERTVL